MTSNHLTDPLPPASPAHKILTALYGSAIGDALGAPCEFQSRGSFPLCTTYSPNPNFGTPAGIFTDDTSMVLCLAQAIILNGHALPPPPAEPAAISDLPEETLQFAAHQALLFVQWWKFAHYSPMDRCFDIGNQITAALGIWSRELPEFASKPLSTTLPTKPKDADLTFGRRALASSRVVVGSGGRNNNSPQTNTPPPLPTYPTEKIKKALLEINKSLNKPVRRGNGTLMRILPLALASYNLPTPQLLHLAHVACMVSHPDVMCVQACQIYSWLIQKILLHSKDPNPKKPTLTKLDLLHLLTTTYPTQISPAPLQRDLAGLLKPEIPRGAKVEDIPATHPLFNPDPPSSGYVLHTLHAVLATFFTTSSFHEGLIKCVNYGDDADTVAAIWAGLGGAWYADREGEVGGAEGWFRGVGCGQFGKAWWEGLRMRDWVTEAGEAVVELGGWGLGERGEEQEELVACYGG
ncbi:ADP-ribosylation/Crystallin J1 [Peziza echinospora]|nr:ADP-ribosylation/Crystallin J1 [Peziza echinospora]